MRKVKSYKCPICKKSFKTLGGWISHMNSVHPDDRMEGFTDTQYFYFTITGRTQGNCIVCKSKTYWNETTGKYNKFCEDPKCKEAYREQFKKRMVAKYGKVHLLNDPDKQREMLKNRKISGSYKFSDGGMVDYVGSYEKDFLEMLDKFLGYDSNDIMAPSPHTYRYIYEGDEKFYIPDYFIPNLNLEIEVKDTKNQHHKILAVDRVKEKLKDEVLKSVKTINYLKINDKDYKNLFEYLLNLKEMIPDKDLEMAERSLVNSTMESVIELDYSNKEFEAIQEAKRIVGIKDETILIESAGIVEEESKEDPKYTSIMTECYKLINQFTVISPIMRYEKAEEIYNIITENNLGIDISFYPKLSEVYSLVEKNRRK